LPASTRGTRPRGGRRRRRRRRLASCRMEKSAFRHAIWPSLRPLPSRSASLYRVRGRGWRRD
jgi:hypothetical protein